MITQTRRKLKADMHLSDRRIYLEFACVVTSLGQKVRQFTEEEHRKGRKVYVHGASTKGNTLLQFWNLDHNIIVASAEKNPDR